MSTALKQMTADEFLLWAEGKEGRWELHDGAPLMMSPERLAHIRTKKHVVFALDEAISRAGLPSEAFADGVAIKIDARTVFEPDASIVCGPRKEDDAIVIIEPVVVVEVLSPSTAAIDHGRKLSSYFSLPSVEHYLILDPNAASRFTTSAGRARRLRPASCRTDRRGSTRRGSSWRLRRSSHLRGRTKNASRDRVPPAAKKLTTPGLALAREVAPAASH